MNGGQIGGPGYGEWAQQQALMPKYRPDAGSALTDAQYAAWQHTQQLTHAQDFSNIGTNAQSKLGTEQFQHQLGLQESGQQSAAQLQASQLQAAKDKQAQAEAAAAGLQKSGFAGQMDLQTNANNASLASQTQHEKAGSDLLNQQAGLQAKADLAHQASIDALMKQFTGPTVAGAGQDFVDPGLAQESTANAAAFARAKDQAGQIGRSSVTALQNVGAARGFRSGSGITNSAVGQAINQGATQLGDVNREQAITGATLARQRASEQYQGRIAQRGQNMNLAGSVAGLMNTRAY